MEVKIYPSQVQGSIQIPSSKSLSHRAILCAGLADKTSTITNLFYSKDIEATMQCIQNLGAKIHKDPTSCRIQGTSIFQQAKDYICPCNESGSTLRFLIPIGALTSHVGTFTGKGRLLQRPMTIYEKIFRDQGLFYLQEEDQIQIQGPLKPQHFTLPGNISSQFISGLLLALPLLEGSSTITIQEPYESRSYVDLTIQMLRRFGITIKEKENQYFIPGRQCYRSQDIAIEGDASQMAFFGVLACLNHELTFSNMNPESIQGDRVILEHLKTAGSTIHFDATHLTISKCRPQAQRIDLTNCPDLGPILCVLASFSKGTTTIYNAQRLRLKESDRILAMETELKKWGVPIYTTNDTITIHGKKTYEKEELVFIDSHNDHRIAMAMTIFGLCAKSPSIIQNAQAIEKSYPNFFQDIQSIHGKVEIV